MSGLRPRSTAHHANDPFDDDDCDEAPFPSPFDAPTDEPPEDSDDNEAPVPEPFEARPSSPDTSDGPPSSDEFSDEGVGFVMDVDLSTAMASGFVAPSGPFQRGTGVGVSGLAQTLGTGLHLGNQEEDVSFGAGTGTGSGQSLTELHQMGDVPLPSAEIDDEAVGLGITESLPSPDQGQAAGGPAMDGDDEGVSFGSVHLASSSLQQPPPSPRPRHVSPDLLLCGETTNPRLPSNSAFEALPSMGLNPMNMLDDDVPPDVSLPEQERHGRMGLSSGHTDRFSPPTVTIHEMDDSDEALAEHEEAVVPASPSEAGMEQVRKRWQGRSSEQRRKSPPDRTRMSLHELNVT